MLGGQYSGAYYCKVCDCTLRDSANYLLHINGRVILLTRGTHCRRKPLLLSGHYRIRDGKSWT